MKKLIYGSLFLALVGMVIVGCQKDTVSQLKEMKTTKTEDFFDEVSKMNLETSDENVIYINYEWDKNNKTISIKEVKEAEVEFFVLGFRKDKALKRRADVEYTVECANGDNSWTKVCDEKWSCGDLVGDCLEQGGCATICNASMIYAPQIHAFYIGSTVSSSIKVFKKSS